MRALVTGAAGFVGSEIVHQLLAKGYDVVATARDASGDRCAHLTALASALPGTLELVSADLLQEGSFDEAAKGCDFIFHVASPFILATDDPQRELLDPALCGTVNLLNSAAKEQERRRKAGEEDEAGADAGGDAGGVRRRRRPLRVVLTSSVAAVHGEYASPPTKGRELYSEEDWNETSTVQNGQAYHLSKATAEREAWKVAGAKGIDLVTVCPNFVLGPPPISSSDARPSAVSAALKGSISVSYVRDLVEGAKAAGGKPIIADVRDVARAHVVAAESPDASGRYIVSRAASVLPDDIRAAIAGALCEMGFEEEAQSLPAAEEPLEGAGVPRIDATRTAEELGVSARPAGETLRDAAMALVKLGVAVPASKVGAKE